MGTGGAAGDPTPAAPFRTSALMEIVEPIKLAIGVAFGLVGIAVLYLARGTRGFGQRKQVGALLLVAALVFAGVGLGLIDLGGD